MWFVLGLLFLFLGLGLVFRLLENGLIYYPEPLAPGVLDRRLEELPPEPDETWEEARLPTADGETLVCWLGVPREPRGFLLWFHGNAGNNANRFGDLVELVRTARLGVLLVDYRGYGGSSGKPTEAGLYLDARAAREFLLGRGVAPSRLLYLGRSLGGAVAVELATEHPPRGLVLESTFTSVREMARRAFPWFPTWWFAKSRFPTEERIARLDVPILLFHGREDALVPLEQGERLAAAARPGRVGFVPVVGAGHDDVSRTLGPEYFRAVAEFVDYCLSED